MRIKSNLLPLWLIAACFGPYVSLSLGLRAEQIIIYTLFPLSLIKLSLKSKSTILSFKPLFSILALLIIVTTWTLVITFIGEHRYVSFTKVVSHFEKYLQPIAIIIIIGVFVKCRSRNEVLSIFKKTSNILIVFLVFNTLMVILSILFDMAPILQYFTAPPVEEGYTVAEASMQMGRYTGIFNQPAESGLSYSLGLLLWVYLNQDKQVTTIFDFLTFILLILGGFAAVSKVFIFGGFPLAIIYLFWIKRVKLFLNKKFLLIILPITFVIIFFVIKSWEQGLSFLLIRLTRFNIEELSGKRFGVKDGSGLTVFFKWVWNEAPLQGFGFAAMTTLDSGYLTFFLQGGLIALLLILFVQTSIGWTGLKQLKKKYKEGKLIIILSVFVIVGGIGVSAFTINRFSTMFWVVLTLLYYIIYSRPLLSIK